METGTIKETQLFMEFHEYVIGKFERMGNFSKIATGKRNTFSHIAWKTDNKENRVYILGLNERARTLVYDKSKVYISPSERFKIKFEVNSQIIEKRITQIQFFLDIHISINIYKQIVNGLNIYKNESYEKLTNILFE